MRHRCLIAKLVKAQAGSGSEIGLILPTLCLTFAMIVMEAGMLMTQQKTIHKLRLSFNYPDKPTKTVLIEYAKEAHDDITPAEKTKIRKRFRESLLRRRNASCRISGVRNPKLLIASHIKPLALCTTNHEAVSRDNGLLLIRDYDYLFDKGFISFNNDGSALFSDKFSAEDYVDLGLHIGTNIGELNDEQIYYMGFHRRFVFKG